MDARNPHIRAFYLDVPLILKYNARGRTPEKTRKEKGQMQPSIIVHGGAGDIPSDLREAHRQVLIKGLSVRETEKLAKRLNQPKKKSETLKKSIYFESVQEKLMQWLGTKVRISKSGKKGKIVIEFYSSEELERIIERIKGGNEQARF